MSDSIQFCLSNVREVDHPRAEGRLCLQRCGLCYDSPFLLVDGEVRVGECHDAILESVPEVDGR